MNLKSGECALYEELKNQLIMRGGGEMVYVS